MYKKWLCFLICSVFLTTSVSADERADDQAWDKIQRTLQGVERALRLDGVPASTQQAILQKDLELKRNDYARSVQLVFEGIESQKELEKARAAYEKQLIQSSAGSVPIGKVLSQIKKLRQQIPMLGQEILAGRALRTY
jgi:multidrug resistance efflux pump